MSKDVPTLRARERAAKIRSLLIATNEHITRLRAEGYNVLLYVIGDNDQGTFNLDVTRTIEERL